MEGESRGKWFSNEAYILRNTWQVEMGYSKWIDLAICWEWW
jgi:hypothetical protein